MFFVFVSYDDYAQKWTNKRQSGQHLAHEFLEKPAIYGLLPPLEGKKVLAIGCGSGQECDYLLQKGAEKVVGIDSSKGLIEQAKYLYPAGEFQTMEAQNLQFPVSSFDLAFSSLTLHYLASWPDFFRSLRSVLSKNGQFLFSVHHPVKWGALANRSKESNQFVLGYKKFKTGEGKEKKWEIYGDYLNFRPVSDTLFGQLPITFYHRSLSQMFREITENGFQIVQMVEPQPIPESAKKHPDFFEVYSKIPLFLIFLVQKVD